MTCPAASDLLLPSHFPPAPLHPINILQILSHKSRARVDTKVIDKQTCFMSSLALFTAKNSL